MTKINVAVLGYGFWGKDHIRVFSEFTHIWFWLTARWS